MGPEDRDSRLAAPGTSRRAFIRNSVVAGGALVGGPALLSACGGGTASTSGSVAEAGTPKRGGALTLGVSGGSSQDTLDPHKWSSQIDGARVCQMYEWLAARKRDASGTMPFLGTEFTPNATGDEITVKLRPGVTFHNGKSLTSEDVVFTYHRILDPKEGTSALALFGPVIDRVEAVDPLTVRFKLKLPFNAFEDFVSNSESGIIPVGWDPKNPVGTGPFKFHSMTPGQQSVFNRNENYWDSPRPYVDSVTIIDLTEDSARVNALVSGAVDAIDSVPYALIPSVQANPNLQALISETGNWYPITMRVDRAPFNDPRVRQAFKWIVDRPQMIKEAYGSRARLGNDLFAIDDPVYAHQLLQRQQDIEKAKFLLKQAGHDGLTVNLVTAPIENGVVESCVVFAQQAKAAGVNVQLTKLDNTTFYNDQYLQRVFSVDWWDAQSFLSGVAYTLIPTASYGETHYNNAQFNKWYLQAAGAKDLATKKEICLKMQQQLWYDGGHIIPGFLDNIDAYSKKITGFVTNKTGFNLNYWGCKDVWFV